MAFGIHLFQFEGAPVAILQRTADGRHGRHGRQRALLAILTADHEASGRLIARIRTLMRERSVLRGRVLSFSGSAFDDESAAATFASREVVDADSVVLAPGVLDTVRRHAIGIGEQRDMLLAAGQHLKRGILQDGPPGTGKTLTVRHLVGASEGTTVVLLAGRTIQFIGAAADLARALQRPWSCSKTST